MRGFGNSELTDGGAIRYTQSALSDRMSCIIGLAIAVACGSEYDDTKRMTPDI